MKTPSTTEPLSQADCNKADFLKARDKAVRKAGLRVGLAAQASVAVLAWLARVELVRGWPLALSCLFALIAGIVGFFVGGGLALHVFEKMESTRKAGGEIRPGVSPRWAGK